MNSGPTDDIFVRQLTDCQPRLLAFVFALLPDLEAARDVLQETNVVLWRKSAEFEPGSDFMAWACQIARFKVLAHLRDKQRDRHLFDLDLVAEISSDAERHAGNTSRLAVLLDECIQLRGETERALLSERYAPGGSVTDMAVKRSESPGSVSVALNRIRKKLMDCVQHKLTHEASQ